MTDSAEIVNQALAMMGHNANPVTGLLPAFDGSPAGKAAARLYLPTVRTVARQKAWDFGRKTASLVLSGNGAVAPFAYEYVYPLDAVQLWQVMPPNADPFNPQPVNYQEAIATIDGVPAKVIRTNLAGAVAFYAFVPPESAWDSLFREAVVSLLASNFAMALAGKPDAMAAFQERGAAFEQIAEGRTD